MCNSQSKEYIRSITCSYDPKFPKPNSIRVELALEKNIAALDRFSISFQNLVNPESTETTQSVEVNIIDSSNYVSINLKKEGIAITTNNAFVISKAAVTPEHKAPGIACPFTIDFYPEHMIQKEGGVLITYPPQITRDPKIKDISV